MIAAFRTLRKIHRVFDEAQKVLEEDIGRPICLPNCGLCCQHNLPHWMTIEAILAISVLTGTGRIKRVRAIAESWLLDRTKEATIHEGMPIGWAKPQLRDEWVLLTRSRCPFLSSDMQCEIHDVRPLTCSAYGVFRDSADLCPRPLGRGESISQRRYIQAPLVRGMLDEFREECRKKNKAWVISGLIPTVFFRAAQEKRFQEYVRDNKIASAKLVGVDFDTTLMWQPQVDALRAGLSPDLVPLVKNAQDWRKFATYKV